MEEKEKTLSRSKSIVLKLAVGLFVFLIICTFVSKSIYTTLLPKVEVVNVTANSLSTQAQMVGKIFYSDEEKIIAESNANILEVFVKQGDKVKKGDKLFATDSSGYTVKKKRLQLAVLSIQNQLKPTEMSASQRLETQSQLDIAKKEFELLEINKSIEKSLSDGQYDFEQAQFREQSALTRAQLDSAYAQWQKFISSTPPAEGYDYALESQYRAAVIQAQNNVLLLDENMSESEKNSVRVAYDLAQEKYKQYLQTNDIQAEISQQKLKLDILKYENMLNPQNISASQKAEIVLSLEIVKQELADFESTTSPDGIVTAADDCEIISVSAEVMSPVNVGDTQLIYRKNEANPCVKWEMSFDAGNNLSEQAEINITFKKQIEEMNFFANHETQTVKVDSMQYDEQTNMWQVTAKLAPFDGTVQTGSMVDIVVNTASELYMSTVPLDCLIKSGENYSVMRVLTRNGLFSAETYVEQIPVKVLDRDNFFAAIEVPILSPQDKLVKYTSKPLSNGTVVSLE